MALVRRGQCRDELLLTDVLSVGRRDGPRRTAHPALMALAMFVAVSSPGHIPKVASIVFYDQDITVESIARRFYFSTSHLYRMMRDAFGKTPSEYIAERRVAQAKQLLEKTELSVAEIASVVGISNGPNLSRMFRAHVGESPTGYRRRAKRREL